MIDNTISIIEGLKNKNDPKELEANANPLGLFPEMKTIKVESDDFSSLYETVLIDTPIGQYFLKFLDSQSKDHKTASEVQAFFKEAKPERVRSSVRRIWLEDFY
jgi:V-type H+-transporting ATPase subunit d